MLDGGSIRPIATISSRSSTTGFADAEETLRSEIPFKGAVPSIAHRLVSDPTPSPSQARVRVFWYCPSYTGHAEAPHGTFPPTWSSCESLVILRLHGVRASVASLRLSTINRNTVHVRRNTQAEGAGALGAGVRGGAGGEIVVRRGSDLGQGEESWRGARMLALEFFGGSVEVLVPDYIPGNIIGYDADPPASTMETFAIRPNELRKAAVTRFGSISSPLGALLWRCIHRRWRE